MPSWAESIIEISGSNYNVSKLLDDMNNEETFLFSNIKPVPKELKEISTGSITINDKKVDRWTYDDENNPVELDENKLQEFTEKYGCTDWYEWQLANWGTKWGDGDTTIREDSTKNDKRRVVITYRSPWSEPYKLLEHISYKYNLRLINRVRYEAEMYEDVHQHEYH